MKEQIEWVDEMIRKIAPKLPMRQRYRLRKAYLGEMTVDQVCESTLLPELQVRTVLTRVSIAAAGESFECI